MAYDLKIRQSYHGSGSKEGYKFKVYDKKGKKLGTLLDLPSDCNVDDTVRVDGTLYIISKIHDSDNPREKRSEVIYFELTKYEFKPDYDVGSIIN